MCVCFFIYFSYILLILVELRNGNLLLIKYLNNFFSYPVNCLFETHALILGHPRNHFINMYSDIKFVIRVVVYRGLNFFFLFISNFFMISEIICSFQKTIPLPLLNQSYFSKCNLISHT